MSIPRLHGAITALVTPFRDGAVDEAAFVALIERQIASGIAGLVPVGTTGETATLDHAEHRRVVELCIETVAGRVPVVAGAGSNATAEAIALARHARAAGADAILVVSPYYNRPSQEGLYRHYMAISDAVDVPIIAYNVPTRTSVDISNETLARLAGASRVIGVKDATGDMARPAIQGRQCGENWIRLSGDDPSALSYMAQGGQGCISVTANVAPAHCAALFAAYENGDWHAAAEIQGQLMRLHRALFLDASPAPTKFALAHLGLCAEDCRLPIAPCADAVRPELVAALAELEITG